MKGQKARRIGLGMARLENPRVNTTPQMLDKTAEDSRVNRLKGMGGVEMQEGSFHRLAPWVRMTSRYQNADCFIVRVWVGKSTWTSPKRGL